MECSQLKELIFIIKYLYDHTFERSDDHDQPTVYVGSPKTCHLAIKQNQGTYISTT